MNGATTVLTKKDLVQIGLENLRLVVVEFKQHRHHGFGSLAAQTALVGEIEILHQLLRQCAASLTHLPGGKVDPYGTGNGLRRHAEMIKELPIFDRDQCFHQIRRHLIELDQNPVFVVRRVKPTHDQWLQPRHRQLAAVHACQSRNEVPGKTHPDTLRLFCALIKAEAACMHFNRVTGDRNSSWPTHRLFSAVAQRIDLGEKVILIEFLPDKQFQRPGIDRRRNRPALAREFLLHHGIEIHRNTGQQHQRNDRKFDNPA